MSASVTTDSLSVSMVTVHVEDAEARQCYAVTVPARSGEEAIRFLSEAGSGLGGEAVREIYLGSVLAPVRHRYHAALAAAATEIAERRAGLGATATEAQLRELAEWAVQRRARAARMWRIPTGPAMQVRLEVRDWRQYGAGGRSFGNMLAREQRKGFGAGTAYENLIRSASTSNAGVDRSVARAARHLRLGGGVLGGLALAMSVREIAAAPAEQRGTIVKHQAVGLAGGLVGGEVMAGAAAIGLGLLMATPPGWLVLTIGLVAGIGGGMAGGDRKSVV